jgi:hypothetical protein
MQTFSTVCQLTSQIRLDRLFNPMDVRQDWLDSGLRQGNMGSLSHPACQQNLAVTNG